MSGRICRLGVCVVFTGALLAASSCKTAPVQDGSQVFHFDETVLQCQNAKGEAGYNMGGAEPCTDFSNGNLVQARMNGSNLLGSNFQSAHLAESELQSANLTYANFMGAALNGAKLGLAKLVKANLREAVLVDADLRGADLTGADLIGAQLKGARYNEDTKLPFSRAVAKREGMVFTP